MHVYGWRYRGTVISVLYRSSRFFLSSSIMMEISSRSFSRCLTVFWGFHLGCLCKTTSRRSPHVSKKTRGTLHTQTIILSTLFCLFEHIVLSYHLSNRSNAPPPHTQHTHQKNEDDARERERQRERERDSEREKESESWRSD